MKAREVEVPGYYWWYPVDNPDGEPTIVKIGTLSGSGDLYTIWFLGMSLPCGLNTIPGDFRGPINVPEKIVKLEEKIEKTVCLAQMNESDPFV